MSSDARLDRLQHILRRALHRAEIEKEARKRLETKKRAKTVAEDYADRLAEKHLYRELLIDARMDAMRFRWYFTKVAKNISLDELRVWIDRKIIEEDHAQKN